MRLQIELKKNSFKTLSIVLLIIFFISFKNIYKEHFITWYLPFYKSVNTIVPKYLINNNTYSNLKYRYTDKVTFIFNNITFFEAKTNSYYNFLLENILKNVLIENIEIKLKETHLEQISEVNKNKKTMSIVSSPVVYNFYDHHLKEIEIINFISTISFEYLFLISKKSTGINTLEDTKDKRIGIGKKHMETYYIANEIFENLGWDKKNLKIFEYTIEENFSKLLNDEIDCFFFTDLYPSNILNKYIFEDFESQLVLVPLIGLNKELFQTRHRYMEYVTIDLTKLPQNYLPKKIGNKNYTIYRPGFQTYKYSKFIICNKFLDPKISYQIVEGISRNLKIINSSKFVKDNPQNYLNFSTMANNYNNYNNVPTHSGARKFYTEKSVFTQLDSKECVYFVGNLECTNRRIREATILNN